MNSAPPIVPLRHAAHHLNDPHEFSCAISGGLLVADFLAKQECPTRIEQFQTSLWTLDFQEAHVKAHIHCPLRPGWASLGLMRSPVVSSWYGFQVGEGMLMCNPPGKPINGWFPPGFRCLSLSVPVAAWERCRALAHPDYEGLSDVSAIRLPPPVYAFLEGRLKALLPLLRNAADRTEPTRFTLLEVGEWVTSVVTTALELSSKIPPSPSSYRNRTRLAHRAEEWMRVHLATTAQVSDVCLALGVSRREMEYAFRLTFDQSPRDFLQVLRLNAVHRCLMQGEEDASLMDLAFDHGIMHLGRFARNYRTLFGENPSSSRRRKGPHERSLGS